MQTVHSRDMVVLPPLICTILSLVVFVYQGMDLNRSSAFFLIAVYFAYIAYSIYAFGGDAD